MRLGGFVIHGNNADTLASALESLKPVCDEVLALDSGSTDGSAAIAAAAGVRTANHTWEGYGNARATAARMLEGCDYLLYLDADERFTDGAAEVIGQWKRRGERLPYFRFRLHDWADLPGHSFRFRSIRVYRLFRRDAAGWKRQMIVHESVPKIFGPGPMLEGAEIRHRFATSLEWRAEKEARYALLWAVQAQARGVRPKPVWLQGASHTLRNAVVKGALLRGGATGWALSRTVARYHWQKHAALRALVGGAHPELAELYRSDRLQELFARVSQVAASPGRGWAHGPSDGEARGNRV